MDDTTQPELIRLALLSEVSYQDGETARPIHALRTGTFTGMTGTPTTFEPRHLRQMADRLNAMAARRRPPINEGHDYGRAVGRMLRAYTKNRDNDLYIEPKWLSAGRTLLADEVYDGFSIELRYTDDGYDIVGGALTNYPAVDGLATVTLSAPAPDEAGLSELQSPLPTRLLIPQSADAALALIGMPVDRDVRGGPIPPPVSPAPIVARPPIPHKETPMSDESRSDAPIADLPPITDATMQAQINAYVGQMEARFKAQQDAAFQRAQAEFERRIADMEARRQIESYAQHITTPTINRPHALFGTADEWAALLTETPPTVRAKWQTKIDHLLSNGLVAFEEIGSDGEADAARSTADQWQALITAKLAMGMSRVDAIKAAAAAHPDLYAAQATMKGGR